MQKTASNLIIKENDFNMFFEFLDFKLKVAKEIDKDVLLAELENIRKQGYSYSIGQQDAHTTGISYPIYNFKEEVIASLAVSGLSIYYEGDNLTRIKKHAEKTAKEISEELGYREEQRGQRR